MLSRSDLHQYQNRFVEFIKEKKRCAGWLDLGLGKTTSTLTAITDLKDGFAVNKVLIIAPLRVANSVWAQECEKWTHLKHFSVSVATGSERQRIAALCVDADIYAINSENVPWLVEHYKQKWPFDCVVIDEASSFKNPSSQRFKALKKVLPFTEYMVLLTGTPSPKGLLDLWSQIYLLDFGHALGRTMTAYKQRFFESDFMGYKFTPRTGAPEQIQNAIKPLVLSMSAEDYLQLPDRIDLTETVELPAKAMSQYLDFEKTLLAELEDGKEIEAVSAAVLANTLLQFANGAIYTDEHHNYTVIHDAKLDALEELIEREPNENILVAYNYKSDLERIQKRFPDSVMLDKNNQTIKDWNNGKIKLLLAHPASAGHGLNLQAGGSIIVWFGLNWSLELYQQFNGRLHRQGQTKPVCVVHIACKDTIDERLLKVLNSKEAVQNKLLSALKR